MRAATAKKLHWTQRPENRSKLARLHKGRKAKQAKKKETKNQPELVTKWEKLQAEVDERLSWIDSQIAALTHEKNLLVNKFKRAS